MILTGSGSGGPASRLLSQVVKKEDRLSGAQVIGKSIASSSFLNR